MWPAIVFNKISPRKEILINIDPYVNASDKSVAIRVNNYKYVAGMFRGSAEWLGDSGRNSNKLYEPEKVLQSKAGVAIASLYKTTLTRSKILKLRKKAEVRCNIKEKNKVGGLEK